MHSARQAACPYACRSPAWWRRTTFCAPLLLMIANLAFLVAWPTIAGYVFRNTPLWAWSQAIYGAFEAWTLAYTHLIAVWMCFAVDRAIVRYPCAAAATALGTLAILGGWTDLQRLDLFRTYYFPMWPKLTLAAIFCVAVLHLLLYPLRQFLGWRLGFSPPPATPSLGRPFQFTLRDVAHLSIVTAVALGAIRASSEMLMQYGTNDLFFMPSILRLMSFGQIVIPSLACAWLILGRKRQWIGALVLVLALACPAMLYYSSWYIPLSLGVREVWGAHWLNIGAVACVSLNLLILRLCGLRGTIVPR